jgi:hypothetical protein
MSRLVRFYRGQATDTQGRSLHQLLFLDDTAFEDIHDFIQWLFPLPEPSAFNSRAPLLTPQDKDTFRGDATLRTELERSFERFLTFLGLMRTAGGTITEGPNFEVRKADVWSGPNHNWLRISRVLRSLYLLGLEEQSKAFYTWLEVQYRSKRFPIPQNTFGFWTRSASGAL